MLYMHCANCGKVMVVPVTRYRIYGAIIVGLGVLAWRTYFFAGTGCAFELCCGVGLVGVLIFCFANTLACRSISHSCCPHCGQLNWRFGVPLPSAGVNNRTLPPRAARAPLANANGQSNGAPGAHLSHGVIPPTSGVPNQNARRPLPGGQKLAPKGISKQAQDNE